jgi:hypothetical protein
MTSPTPYLDRPSYKSRDDMLGGLRRQLRALPEYAAQTAEVSLGDFRDLAREVQAAQAALVVKLVTEQSWTWAMVGSELGITRTAAQTRYGKAVTAAREARSPYDQGLVG